MIVMPMLLTERLKRLALCEIAEAAAQCVCVCNSTGINLSPGCREPRKIVGSNACAASTPQCADSAVSLSL